jgi:biotin operon repressor
MRHVWTAVKSERRRLNRELPVGILAALCYEPGADPAKLRDWPEIDKSLAELVKRLPERLQGVIAANYGLEDGKPQSLQAIGEKLGLSRERVRQLRNAGLVWLSQPAHSQRLRSLLERHTVAEYEKADRLAQIWLRRRGGRHEHIETVL